MLRIAGGEHRGRKLKAVPGDTTRPTSARVREALFSIAGPRRRVLDGFSGTGAIALEALSRGAERAVAVEKNARAVAVIEENARLLGLEDRLRVIRGDAPGALSALASGEFDLVFADPPYAFEDWERLMAALARTASADGIVVVEHGVDRPSPACPSLDLLREYRYGGTALSVYRPTSQD